MKHATNAVGLPPISEIEIQLTVEELEQKIAPGVNLNHNETFLSEDLEVEFDELEEKIAPGLNLNHNETFIRDER